MAPVIVIGGSTPGTIVKPVFLSRADANSAIDRFRQSKKDSGKAESSPEIRVDSLESLIYRMKSGLELDAKVIEIFPSSSAIDQSKSIVVNRYLNQL